MIAVLVSLAVFGERLWPDSFVQLDTRSHSGKCVIYEQQSRLGKDCGAVLPGSTADPCRHFWLGPARTHVWGRQHPASQSQDHSGGTVPMVIHGDEAEGAGPSSF